MLSKDRAELVETWLREERQPFQGWDFSYLDGRMRPGREPWSYLDRAAALMEGSSSVIDLDTGGGEKLLSLRKHWPARVVVTEDYAPQFRAGRPAAFPSGSRGAEGGRLRHRPHAFCRRRVRPCSQSPR